MTLSYSNFIDTLSRMKMDLLFAFGAAALLSPLAHATSFNIPPFSDFTSSTPNIVRGTLSNVRAENALTDDGGRTVYTFANLAVKEVLKGNIHDSNITLRELGGSTNEMTIEIPSSPEFHENEDAVLFLGSEQEDHSYEVTGLELGKYQLKDVGGDKILTGGIFNYSRTQTGVTPDPRLKENQTPWSLNRLRNLIRSQEAQPPKAAVSPASSPSTLASPAPSVAPETSAAPNLSPDSVSNSASDTDSSSSMPWGSIVLAAIVVGVLLRLYFKSRSAKL